MCRPILDPIASIFHKLFCGRSARSEGTGQALDGSQFPGSGSIEANRRRCGSPSLIILGSSLKPFGSSSTCCCFSYPLSTITNMISTHWLARCSMELEPPKLSGDIVFNRPSHLIGLLSIPCRERGQRALEQRLAEKLAAVRSAEGKAPPSPPTEQLEDDASDKVWALFSVGGIRTCIVHLLTVFAHAVVWARHWKVE